MNLFLLLLLLVLNSLETYASSSPEKEFCTYRKNPAYYQMKLQKDFNHLAFPNYGGLFNGGVCWWHARFTRNATYLALFNSKLEKPSTAEAKKIIKKIRQGKEVVLIPGYWSLREFSQDFEEEIQEELEDWQIASGTIGFQWIKGLAGGTQKSAKSLKKKMDELYQRVHVEKDVVYQKVQIKGITAHAWLIIGMDKANDGYKLTVIDSNFAGPQVYEYYEGMTNFFDFIYGEFMTYTNFESELDDLKESVSKFCTK